MFGGRFNWIFGMGRRFAPDATIVQVDVEAEELASGAPVSIGVVADAAAAAEQLDGALEGRALSASTASWLALVAGEGPAERGGSTQERSPTTPSRSTPTGSWER